MITVTPEPTRCKGWGHRNCAGHYSQPQPEDIIHLDGPDYTRVSSKPGWFGLGYYRGDGRLTAVTATSGEEYIVRWLRAGTPDAARDSWHQPQEWEAVLIDRGA